MNKMSVLKIVFASFLAATVTFATPFTVNASTDPAATQIDSMNEAEMRSLLLRMLNSTEETAEEPVAEVPSAASSGYGSSTSSNSSGASGYGNAELDYSVMKTWSSDVQAESNEFKSRLNQLHEALPSIGRNLANIWKEIVGQERDQGYLVLLTVLVAMFASGIFAERFLGRKLQRLLENITSQDTTSAMGKCAYALTRIGFEALLILIFGCAAFVVPVFFLHGDTPMEFTLLSLLGAVVMFRGVRVLLRAVWAPNSAGIRVIDVPDEVAQYVYGWMSIFFGMVVFGQELSELLVTLGLNYFQLIFIVAIWSFTLNSYLYWNFWRSREGITQIFSSGSSNSGDFSLGQVFAQNWPYLFAVWLYSIWALWLYNLFMENHEAVDAVGVAWWITILFPVTDRTLNGLLRWMVGAEWLQSKRFQARSARFVNIVQTGFRLVAIVLSVYVLLAAWGVEAVLQVDEVVGATAMESLIDTIVILVFAYVIWELVQALIERHLPEEPEPSDEFTMEGDGGGAGGSRAETLLPLVRSFLITVLMVFVILSVLHNMGVEITPLLAGAGVVGIAVGFGAQKLVQDILSGIFFLIDDAFRRGEYIEIGELRGTVEKISMRSMQLRHHLGAVQTIPYGEIRTVKNVSRDWVMMKLELRLPYDTDIEKVRKIIKKVGQQMMEDPVIGPDLLMPLKSQGVLRVDESALITRMKFTARPGGQWIARREAYSRVRDALAKEGIHFAHREVRVRLPEEIEQKIADGDDRHIQDNMPAIASAATAAATAAITSDDKKGAAPPKDVL